MFIYYKTTNLVNGKVYYGVHSGDKDDKYLGSGVGLRRAVKLYGDDRFVRENLKFFDTEEEMYSFEKFVITEDVVNDPNTYNMTLGGGGGWSHVDVTGKNNPMMNEETRKKVSKGVRKTRLSNPEYYDRISRENLKRAVEVNTGKNRPEHGKLLSDRAANGDVKWVAVSPEGYSFLIPSLKRFAIERGFNPSTLFTAAKRRVAIESGVACGWYFSKI